MPVEVIKHVPVEVIKHVAVHDNVYGHGLGLGLGYGLGHGHGHGHDSATFKHVHARSVDPGAIRHILTPTNSLFSFSSAQGTVNRRSEGNISLLFILPIALMFHKTHHASLPSVIRKSIRQVLHTSFPTVIYQVLQKSHPTRIYLVPPTSFPTVIRQVLPTSFPTVIYQVLQTSLPTIIYLVLPA